MTLRSTKDVIFALGASVLNAKEHSSIDAHKARNALCFMRIPFGCLVCKFNCKFGFKFKSTACQILDFNLKFGLRYEIVFASISRRFLGFSASQAGSCKQKKLKFDKLRFLQSSKQSAAKKRSKNANLKRIIAR